MVKLQENLDTGNPEVKSAADRIGGPLHISEILPQCLSDLALKSTGHHHLDGDSSLRVSNREVKTYPIRKSQSNHYVRRKRK